MKLPRKLLSFVTAFLLLATMFIAKPPSVKAETNDFIITSANISNNKTNVPRALMLKLYVNFDLSKTTYDTPYKFSLKDSQGKDIPLSLAYGSNCIEIWPYELLSPEMQYTLFVPKDSFTIATESGSKNLSEDFSLTFKTRIDNTIKIGPDGDYPGFDEDYSTVFYIDQSGVQETLNVLVEKGSYYVPEILLRGSKVVILGGYDQTFAKQGDRYSTVLIHSEKRMFYLNFGDNWSENTQLLFKFSNLTFTQDGKELDRTFIPIQVDTSMPYKVYVNIEKCSFKNLVAEQKYFEVDDYASPVSAVIANKASLNLYVSQSEFLNNEYFNGHSGGIYVYSKCYNSDPYEPGPSAIVTVSNSIFADNIGRDSGAIAGKSDVVNGLKMQLTNNTIMNNKGYNQVLGFDEGPIKGNSGGVAFDAASPLHAIDASLTNNIIWGNTVTADDSTKDILLLSSHPSEKNITAIECLLDSNNFSQLISLGENPDGSKPFNIVNNNQLDKDPLVKDSKYFDFHLNSNSPMIDKGAPVKPGEDFEGNIRPQGKGFDIGAYEFASAPQDSVISLTAAAQNVDEAAGKAIVTVKRADNTDSIVTVKYSTSDGTAKGKEDYGGATGTLTFMPGEASKTFEVQIVDDTAVEQDEYFTVTLSDPSEGAILGEIITQTITIKSDDKIIEKPQQVVGFTVASMDIDETSGKALVTVNRTVDTKGKITVNYKTVDGTAKAGEDYTSAAGTLTFEDGETAKTIEVPITNDTAVEQDEAFTVVLSDPSEGAKLGDISTLTINIKSDDKAPTETPQDTTLPKTGSMVDFNVLIILGFVLIMSGVLFARKRRIS